MRQKRLGKKIAAWFLCLSMVMTIVNLPGFTKTVYAAGYNAGDIPGTTGAGTKSDPVLVDTFIELKAALQCSDNLYIELTGMSDTRTGLDYYELEESGILIMKHLQSLSLQEQPSVLRSVERLIIE